MCDLFVKIGGAAGHRPEYGVEHGQRVEPTDDAGKVDRRPRGWRTGQARNRLGCVEGEHRLVRAYAPDPWVRRAGGHDHVDEWAVQHSEAVQLRGGLEAQHGSGRQAQEQRLQPQQVTAVAILFASGRIAVLVHASADPVPRSGFEAVPECLTGHPGTEQIDVPAWLHGQSFAGYRRRSEPYRSPLWTTSAPVDRRAPYAPSCYRAPRARAPYPARSCSRGPDLAG